MTEVICEDMSTSMTFVLARGGPVTARSSHDREREALGMPLHARVVHLLRKQSEPMVYLPTAYRV